jgi:hypothetical protein
LVKPVSADLTAFLLTLSALLWLTDMAGRRFSIGPGGFCRLAENQPVV